MTEPTTPPQHYAVLPRHPRQKFILLGLCVVVLLSGIVIGAVAMHLYLFGLKAERRMGPPPARIVERLCRVIPLTEEQRDKVRIIAERNFTETHPKIMAAVSPMLEQMFIDLKAVIPEQYHGQLEEEHQHMLDMLKRPPSGSMGPRDDMGPGGPPPMDREMDDGGMSHDLREELPKFEPPAQP